MPTREAASSFSSAVAEYQPRKNRMRSTDAFSNYTERLRKFIARHSSPTDGASSDSDFNELALELFARQLENVPPFRELCRAKNISQVTHWKQIPAVPTTAFKEYEMTSLASEERSAVFHSSGTTEQRPSRHFHSADSLAIYEASLLPWFQKNFLGDHEDLLENETVNATEKFGFIILTPPPTLAPNSSLVHMFETVRRELGSRDSFFGGQLDNNGAWTLDIEQVLFGIRKSMCANRPIAIVGTAFSFVHLLDHFEAKNMRYRLAEGSRVLETGGYKGRSRVLPKPELHALITKHLGISTSHIFCEYGMSELSSQAYDAPLAHSRSFKFPAWARVQIISPETGLEVGEGETGLIRIYDLANVRSVMAIQTEDLGIRRGDALELIGRSAVVEPRGCSLMST
ncbi:MAG: putative acyl protein synthase/acyl-CoA reductase-like protein [Verrucomicrobiales bacterium]|nr:putative acyl protein synthase/acyl-CoA reductase-like protein [Verrucomicrobiales bacterium]